MPRVTRHHRPPFDASCDFVASRDIRVNGVPLASGDLIDKASVDARRLGLMYEQRLIQYAPGQVPAQRPAKPLAVGPTDFKRPNVVNHPPPVTTAVRRVRSRRNATA